MAELAQVLRQATPFEDPRVLVDARTVDDAAVYRLDGDRALVVTTDFFTPIVDDPRDFGRIAAANALSDLYAMGARPLFALNVLAFPRKLLGEGIVEEIIRGGAEKAAEAGIAILGGHSIDDAEPKYGLVAMGEVEESRMVRNSGARPGDRLVLTKPLGTGLVSTAIKNDAAPAATVAAAVELMATLNREAAEAMVEVGVRAATDVTGYGLLGHLRNLLRASGVAAEVEAGAVPFIEGAVELAREGHVAGGTRRNAEDLEADVRWEGVDDEAVRTVLCDAQTSGGLLMAVAEDRLEELLGRLEGRTPAAAVVGRIVEGRAGAITVRGHGGSGAS